MLLDPVTSNSVRVIYVQKQNFNSVTDENCSAQYILPEYLPQ